MQTIGYGEDALTLWACTTQLPQVLGELADQSSPAACIFYYRPSFGRGGRARSLFGEFDGILTTSHACYLIESKRLGSSIKFSRGPVRRVRLDPCQTLRHEIFIWLRAKWTCSAPLSWADFVAKNATEFSATFAGKLLVRPGTTLADNLEHLLTHIDGALPSVNVLCFFHPQGSSRLDAAAPDGFSLVQIQYPTINQGGFFQL